MAQPKFRKGDVVSLLAKVQASSRDDERRSVLVQVIGDYRDMLIGAGELTIVRKFFAVGDEIEWEVHTDRKARGIVRAAHAECLWVEDSDETMDTVYPHNKPALLRSAEQIAEAEREPPPVAPAKPTRNDPPPPPPPSADPADDIKF